MNNYRTNAMLSDQAIGAARKLIQNLANEHPYAIANNYVINPDLLGELRLWGLPVVFDSTLEPGEIRLIADAGEATVTTRLAIRGPQS